MIKNRSSQSKILFRQKIILVLFGLSLFFVLLEVSLRLAGFILLFRQEYRNSQSLKQKGAYRILCLGESTTQGQYPQFLEEVLNQRNIGVRFSVIDKGTTGMNTLAILSQVEFYLNEYRPDMVVTMMGINDGGEYTPFEVVATSRGLFFIRSFRIYKLSRLLWLHLRTKIKETGIYKPNEDKRCFSNFTGIELREAPAEPTLTEDALKKAIELNPKNDSAYFELGKFYQEQGKYSQAEEALKKAIELNSENDNAYVRLSWSCQEQGKYSQAEDLFKKVVEFDPKNDCAYGALLSICKEIGKPGLAKEYAQKVNRLRLQYCKLVTVNNYCKLKQILDKRKIKLVCVQYPMRNIQPLKKMLKEDENIIFVDNERIFKEVVKDQGYNLYFVDMFGGDFGHCTPKGNRLLADNIANTILKEIFGK